MALTDENGGGSIPATMLVGPTTFGNQPYPVFYGNGGGNNSGFDGNGWWIILFILLLAGGWNNNNGGGFGGGSGTGNLYPWMNQAEITTNGFQNQLLNDNVTSIRDGINNISTQLCTGFAGIEQGANARQIANMQQAFGAQVAMMQGFNGIQSQFADCCCENRLANCQTQNIIGREASETRFADLNNTRDIIQSQTSGTQAILDKLCQLELDAKNDKISDLERQLTMANLAASQTAQTAQLERGQLAATTALVNELRSCPIPSQPVYGSQPIFTCPNNNNSCGCGCGGF